METLESKTREGDERSVRVPDACQRRVDVRQCAPSFDALLFSYTNDVACGAKRAFSAKGLDDRQLRAFARRVPVFYPWTPGYDTVRLNSNRRLNVFPLAIVMAQSEADVVQALGWAVDHKLRLATRSGGHSNEAFSLCGGVVIDQSCRTASVVVVPDAPGAPATVRVESGVTNGLAALELARHGLAVPAGTCESVCLSGLSLGGGIGFLQRALGLTCDSLLEARVVLAPERAGQPPRTVVASGEGEHSDLYWALRGAGGGNFGIVTSLLFRAYRIPRVVLYTLRLSPAAAADVAKWQDWARSLSNAVTAEANLLALGGRGQTEFVVTGESLLSVEETRAVLAPMLALGPGAVEIECVPYVDAVRHYNGPRVRPVYRRDHSLFVGDRGLAPGGLRAMVELLAIAPAGSKFEVETMGGQINALANDATAFPHRHGTGFWILVSTAWSDPDETPRRLEWALLAFRRLWPWGNGGAYVNMADVSLGRDYLRAYYGRNVARLGRVKRKYDPHNVFEFPQGIPPAETTDPLADWCGTGVCG